MLDDPTFKFQSWCGSEMGVLQQNVHQQEKTKPLSVHRRRITAKLNEDPPLRLDVKIDDSVVEQVSSHKILGVVIDNSMNANIRNNGLLASFKHNGRFYARDVKVVLRRL